MKSNFPYNYADRILMISGGIFLIDGISLLWRGGVGILFLFHESFVFSFLVIFLLHTFIAGAAYTLFGFYLLREKIWVRKFPGWIIALSTFFWIFPVTGRDFFTAAAGAIYLIGLIFPRNKKSGNKMERLGYREEL
jgi:hypothetical protein